MDEAFLDLPAYALHPQSFTMEAHWISCWFQRLLKLHYENSQSEKGSRIYIADRSPYSAVFYAQNGSGKLLEPIIRKQIEELRSIGIEIYTVHLKVEKELLWERIQRRLEREPERVKYNEHSREWMQTTLDFYDNYNWDFTIYNGHNTIPELMYSLIRKLSSQVESFKSNCHYKMLHVSPVKKSPPTSIRN
eukprot:GEZU01009185.1.p1 GENE.GEZU01009185.1~~GEZU01009185.1.p1  ORF type:complete len:191 (-),score=26.79 GEZU01009185.1:59-631(-)